MRNKVMLLVGAAALVGSTAFAGPGDWTFAGSFYAPYHTADQSTTASAATNRIAIDSTGKMYVTVGTNDALDKLIWSTQAPTTDFTTPTYTLVGSVSNEDMANGWQGLAIGASDVLYASGDDGAGTVMPDQIRKYDSAGSPVTAFGTNGTVFYDPNAAVPPAGAATRRFSSVGVMSNGDIMAIQLLGQSAIIFDGTSGDELTSFTWGLGGYARDIAVVQDSVNGNDTLFVMRNGSLRRITGGSTSNYAGYQTIEPWTLNATPPPYDTTFNVKPGVGYFAKDNTLMHGNWDPAAGGTENNAYVVDAANGNTLQVLSGIYRAGDLAAFTSGATDYLYVLNGSQFIQVYTKPTTPPAAVAEWSLY